jgi:hypothetical protein
MTLRVYLDQSARAEMLSRYFGLITAVTLLLLGAGIAAPVALAWTKAREKKNAEERLRYLENYDPLTGFPNARLSTTCWPRRSPTWPASGRISPCCASTSASSTR